ncbi:amidohydrolase [Bradyrhizobium sp.]|uniref:amidohydrolase n=1 Tax=Bradyrhizobium sp. TaxID=376 RepID=UPI0039E5B7BC
MRQAPGHADDGSDYVLCGRVLTLDSRSTVAEAVAVRHGRFAGTGTRDEMTRLCPGARVIRTDGVVIPGFNDSHAHMDTEGLREHFPSLSGARSIDDVLTRISALARQTAPGQWIVTMPVGEQPFYYDGPLTLAEKRMPNRAELDRAAPDHPVCILPPSSYWGLIPCHAAVNSRALSILGITGATKPRIKGIEVLHDSHGEPTGVFVERNFPDAMQLDLLGALPRVTASDRRNAITKAMRTYHAHGVTSIYEGHGCATEILSAYRQIHEDSSLTMRVGAVVSPTWTSLGDAERQMSDWLAYARGSGLGDDRLRVSGLFVNYGGDPAVGSVALSDTGNLGWSCYVRQANDPESFEALCRLAAAHDLRLHTIVIDKLHEIVPILKRIDAEYHLDGRRWVLEHVSIAAMEDLAALKALGVGVTLIPEFHLSKAGNRFASRSDDECAMVAPLVQLSSLGIPVAAGSDNSPVTPFAGMRAMMTRQERTTGRVLGSSACAPAEVALRALTVNGAWLTFEEHVKGAIVPGNYADLAVLSDDPLGTPADSLERIACVATMVGGQFVHGASEIGANT